jgi:hypothetical protein
VALAREWSIVDVRIESRPHWIRLAFLNSPPRRPVFVGFADNQRSACANALAGSISTVPRKRPAKLQQYWSAFENPRTRGQQIRGRKASRLVSAAGSWSTPATALRPLKASH